MKKSWFITLTVLLLISNIRPSHAWDGYDYDSENYIEIESRQSVIPGNEIKIYDHGDGSYHDVHVISVTLNGFIAIEVFDHDTGDYRTFQMTDEAKAQEAALGYPAAAVKEPAGGDGPIGSTGSYRVSCHPSPKFFVVEKNVKGAAGTDFLIKYRSKADEKMPCQYDQKNGDFEIKNEWAEYFAGLKNDLLILDSTTGPGPSGLIIWDLVKRKKVFEGSWSDPEESGDDTLVYWMETGEATQDNCPEIVEWSSKGLGGAIETRVSLNLADFTISKTRETRCSPRQ